MECFERYTASASWSDEASRRKSGGDSGPVASCFDTRQSLRRMVHGVRLMTRYCLWGFAFRSPPPHNQETWIRLASVIDVNSVPAQQIARLDQVSLGDERVAGVCNRQPYTRIR